MHTEAEARKLWCPFARLFVRVVVGSLTKEVGPFNRVTQDANGEIDHAPVHLDCRCIASECAAWRWAERFSDTRDGSDAVLGKTYEPGMLEEMGYCGLAGRP